MGGLEGSGCMQKTIRGLFIAFNILFCIIALIFIGVGSYVVHKANTSDYNDLLKFFNERDNISTANPKPAENLLVDARTARAGLLAVGGFIITFGLASFIISTCGWLGALRQNACLLFTFSIVLIIIVLVELILGIVAVVAVKKLKGPNGELKYSVAKELLNDADLAYNGNDTLKSVGAGYRLAWDDAQKIGECCGLTGPINWRNDSLAPLFVQKGTIPASCYSQTNKEPYEEGCWTKVTDTLHRMSGALGGTIIFFALVEILGIVISCYLAFNMRKGAGSPYEQH